MPTRFDVKMIRIQGNSYILGNEKPDCKGASLKIKLPCTVIYGNTTSKTEGLPLSKTKEAFYFNHFY